MKVRLILSTRSKLALLGLVVLAILYWVTGGRLAGHPPSAEVVARQFALAEVYHEQAYMEHLATDEMQSRVDALPASKLPSALQDERIRVEDLTLVAQEFPANNRAQFVFDLTKTPEPVRLSVTVCRVSGRWKVCDFLPPAPVGK